MVDLATAHKTGMGSFSPHESVVWNRTATTLVVGQAVMLDHTAGQDETVEGDVEDGRPGMDSAIESNVILPATAFLGYGVFGVVKSLMSGAGADNTKVLVAWSGLVQALVDDATAATCGDAIYCANGDASFLHAAATGGQKYLGYLREATAGAAGGDVLASAMFDGVNGIGQAPES